MALIFEDISYENIKLRDILKPCVATGPAFTPRPTILESRVDTVAWYFHQHEVSLDQRILTSQTMQ